MAQKINEATPAWHPSCPSDLDFRNQLFNTREQVTGFLVILIINLPYDRLLRQLFVYANVPYQRLLQRFYFLLSQIIFSLNTDFFELSSPLASFPQTRVRNDLLLGFLIAQGFNHEYKLIDLLFLLTEFQLQFINLSDSQFFYIQHLILQHQKLTAFLLVLLCRNRFHRQLSLTFRFRIYDVSVIFGKGWLFAEALFMVRGERIHLPSMTRMIAKGTVPEITIQRMIDEKMGLFGFLVAVKLGGELFQFIDFLQCPIEDGVGEHPVIWSQAINSNLTWHFVIQQLFYINDYSLFLAFHPEIPGFGGGCEGQIVSQGVVDYLHFNIEAG